MSLLENCNEKYITNKLNDIDNRVTKIMLRAEKNNASQQYQTEWLVALHQQSLLCRYWSTIKRGMKNGWQTRRQTTKLYKRMSADNQQSLDEKIKGLSDFQLNQLSQKELKRSLTIKRELARHHVELRTKG
jgi:hypothetical protein